jgi:hypothetical protein
VTFFGVEDGGPTDWAEAEYELGSLFPDTNVFGAVPKTLNHAATAWGEEQRRGWEKEQSALGDDKPQDDHDRLWAWLCSVHSTETRGSA